jgi:beta-N-acetylhexosaminidase
MKLILILISSLVILQSSHALGSGSLRNSTPKAGTNWVDSVFNSLTADQRISQLFMIRAFSDRDSIYNDSLTRVIGSWNVGGVCFFKGAPYRQAVLTNRLQKAVQTPLLIGIDAEWGMGMRLDSAFAFPKQMTLGATRNDSLTYQMAVLIAKDCRRLGIQMNFAPDVDINNNPSNPVIGFRSFGEDKHNVATKGVAYMKGLQDEGIFATAKHFPGHGNTDNDSHLVLPVIRETKEEMDSTELFPFLELIKHGVNGIMVGHLSVPSYDSTKDISTSLSSKIVDSLLKKQLGFRGFVITDALDMKAITKFYKPGEIEVRALEAGNDILLLPQHIDMAVKGIRQACDSSVVLQEILNEKCKRILFLKYKLGLSKLQPISTAHIYEDLNSPRSSLLSKEIYKSAITLVKNEDQMIPLTFLDHRKIAVLSIGDTNATVFQEMLGKYAPMKRLNLSSRFSKTVMDSIISQLSENDIVIIGIHCYSSYPTHHYGFPELAISLIDSLSTSKKIILDIFGSPYTLSFLKSTKNIPAILISYMNTPDAEDASAQLIFGSIPAKGKLPVSGSSEFRLHTGEMTESTRLEFLMPEELGISSDKLNIIDSLALLGIEKKAYPGCQILFAKDGKVFYEKSFGHPRYEDTIPVNNNDLYDIASLTKVSATTLVIMKLYEQGKISLDGKLGYYLHELKGSNKESLTIRNVMTHQAGLQSWIKFYDKTLINGRPDPTIYQQDSSSGFSLRVANGLYMSKSYEDSIFLEIIRSPVSSNPDYIYSDLGFYLLKRIIEKLSGKKMEDYLDTEIYHPLGLTTTCFHPRYHFPVSQIMPTEYDITFRQQQIRGDVHDPGAAMLGGVSGHAGVFSNTADLAVILQIFLNGGSYGGKQYFLPSTIKEFTRYQFPNAGNRRALGFDKPIVNYSPDGPVCKSASPLSFGHSGFTGTYLWADPSNGLIYIFLSNRVYPDATNKKLADMNLRTRIHQAMYNILEAEKK